MSPDPQFVDKVRDIVGLYLNPPEAAAVLCVDNKTGVQAMDRTTLILPLMPACPKRKHRPVDYTYLHVAIGDYSRVANVAAHDHETTKTLVGFWHRTQGWLWSNDMTVDEVLTDNGANFVSDAFATMLAERRIVHRRTRPYRPPDQHS